MIVGQPGIKPGACGLGVPCAQFTEAWTGLSWLKRTALGPPDALPPDCLPVGVHQPREKYAVHILFKPQHLTLFDYTLVHYD